MRTARSLTDRISCYQARGACMACTPRPRMLPSHACPPATHIPRPCTPRGHAHPQPCMPPGHACPSGHACPPGHAHPPPVNRMTNRCKNITLPQTSFAGGNKIKRKHSSRMRITHLLTLSNCNSISSILKISNERQNMISISFKCLGRWSSQYFQVK